MHLSSVLASNHFMISHRNMLHSERGAINFEYILLCAVVALALGGTLSVFAKDQVGSALMTTSTGLVCWVNDGSGCPEGADGHRTDAHSADAPSPPHVADENPPRPTPVPPPTALAHLNLEGLTPDDIVELTHLAASGTSPSSLAMIAGTKKAQHGMSNPLRRLEWEYTAQAGGGVQPPPGWDQLSAQERYNRITRIPPDQFRTLSPEEGGWVFRELFQARREMPLEGSGSVEAAFEALLITRYLRTHRPEFTAEQGEEVVGPLLEAAELGYEPEYAVKALNEYMLCATEDFEAEYDHATCLGRMEAVLNPF